MSEQKDQPELTAKAPTPEQLKQRKQDLTAFYKGELPLLRLQAEYEELITKIDVAKMQRLEIMMAKAQMMEGQGDRTPQGQPQEQSENQEHVRPVNTDKAPKEVKPKNRTLKKVK